MIYLFFDTETNGLPSNYNAPVSDTRNWPRMLQLAWALVDYSPVGHLQELEQHNYLINPAGQFEIEPGAAAVHGLTLDRLTQEGYQVADALGGFTEALKEADYLVAHNISFDLAIVGAELYRAGMHSELNQLFGTSGCCTMKRSTEFCNLPGGKYGPKWPNLQELHTKLFGIDFSGAHDALADVRACLRCFFELQKLGVIHLGGVR